MTSDVFSLQYLIYILQVWFEDSAIYYELDKIDRHPSITGASDKSACSSQTQGMLHWLREQRDKVAWAMLVENLDKSDETHVTYETYRCDFGATVEDLVDATFEGCNVSNSNGEGISSRNHSWQNQGCSGASQNRTQINIYE